MSDLLQQRLAQLSGADALPVLSELRRGIEKESLRVNTDGQLATTPHPKATGSALTHPLITTDYSEALMEFITPVSTRVDTTLDQLDQVHRFVYSALGDEILWNASMPCVMGPDASIPVAQYGSSNSGRMKTIYRVGLGHRYGRRMQTIAGIHYNFSVPEALWPQLGYRDQAGINDAYFGLIRNFRRSVWLPVYLFGASPALCRSFVEDREHALETLDSGTLYLPYATALRMGDLGYQSNAQQTLPICYNRLDSYIATLKGAILDAHPDYSRIGIKVGDEYHQLSAGLLQIENEFYSPIRPKRVARRGEPALAALANGGVEYIEVRCIDINPYLPLGIDAPQMRFFDVFLLWCLLRESPAADSADVVEGNRNLRTVVNTGRQPGLELSRNGTPLTLTAWATEALTQMQPIAALLDRANDNTLYSQSLKEQFAKVADASLTPSARILADLRQEPCSWGTFALAQSVRHEAYFSERPLDDAHLTPFLEMAERSLEAQAALEAADREATDHDPFETYLARYFDKYREL